MMADYIIIGSPDHGEDNRRSVASTAREALAMYCDTIVAGFREDQVKVAGPDGSPLTRRDLERLAETEQDA
jgi:hypothetical protein